MDVKQKMQATASYEVLVQVEASSHFSHRRPIAAEKGEMSGVSHSLLVRLKGDISAYLRLGIERRACKEIPPMPGCFRHIMRSG